MTAAVASLWAQGEFGQAQLGDERRTQRLVEMAADVAQKPAGKLTQVWEEGPERQGAYRLLESEAVEVEAMRSAALRAAFSRAKGPLVFVPTDGSALNVLAARDKPLSKGFGPVVRIPAMWNTRSGRSGTPVPEQAEQSERQRRWPGFTSPPSWTGSNSFPGRAPSRP
jgi:hypothetical protein